MSTKFTDLHCKEVICVSDGRRLGYISDACVEIPVEADANGYRRLYQGRLPSSVAPLVAYTASIENLVIEGWEKRSRQMIYQAVSLDPLCSAVLSLDEVRRMCDELFEINCDYLGDFT